MLLTSPTDARFSQLGAGSQRQQYPDIRALVSCHCMPIQAQCLAADDAGGSLRPLQLLLYHQSHPSAAPLQTCCSPRTASTWTAYQLCLPGAAVRQQPCLQLTLQPLPAGAAGGSGWEKRTCSCEGEPPCRGLSVQGGTHGHQSRSLGGACSTCCLCKGCRSLPLLQSAG